MRIRAVLREGLSGLIIFSISAAGYGRFLLTPVLDVVSMGEWIVIGILTAMLFGMICRNVIRNPIVLLLAAASGFVAAGVWAELCCTPLSHDTAASSTWTSYLLSSLDLWHWQAVGAFAVVSGWYLAHRCRM
jgi:hypothetical protein